MTKSLSQQNATLFTVEELLLIDAFKDITSANNDYNKIAEVLLKNLGNVDLNKRLRDNPNTANKKLATLIYKTEQYEATQKVLTKANIALKLEENAIPVLPEEKISISDIGKCAPGMV
ncbi:MAG: hypothetical protein AB8B66_01265 [Rickettsiaceae bacterium]